MTLQELMEWHESRAKPRSRSEPRIGEPAFVFPTGKAEQKMIDFHAEAVRLLEAIESAMVLTAAK